MQMAGDMQLVLTALPIVIRRLDTRRAPLKERINARGHHIHPLVTLVAFASLDAQGPSWGARSPQQCWGYHCNH